VVISNPYRTRAIAEAKIKTDKVDAAVLAQLLAADYLPEVWQPDERTQMLRRLVGRRARLVQQRTRLRNQVHGILHRNLIGGAPVTDIFGVRGQAWLRSLLLPADERSAIESALHLLEALQAELDAADGELARIGRPDPAVAHLLTIPGVDAAVAVGVLSTIGDIGRFSSPQRLVSYLGLDPRVRQSGNQPAHTGPISKQGRAHARGLLTEAAWAAAKYPGPLRAFFLRVRTRRGPQIAAVATARKLAVLVWYLLTRDEDYAWAGASLTATKLRKLELAAGAPSRRGGRRSWAASSSVIRAQERAVAAGAEEQYRRFVAAWRTRPPKAADAGAATGERLSGALAPAARQG